MSTVGSRLREERERLKLSQSAFAECGRVGKHSQINYERDRRQPDSKYLVAIEKIGVDIMYVLTGKRQDDIARDLFEANDAYHERIEADRAAGWIHVDYCNECRTDPFPTQIAFTKSWFDRLGLTPDQVCFCEMPDDNMGTTLPKGALVMVRITKPSPMADDNDIWAYKVKGKLAISRLGFLGETTLIIHDKPGLKPAIASNLTIIGEVVWSGHVLR